MAQRLEDFSGALIGVFRINTLLDPIARRYGHKVLFEVTNLSAKGGDPERIYSSGKTNSRTLLQQSFPYLVNLPGGHQWMVRLTPFASYQQQFVTSAPWVSLLTSLVLWVVITGWLITQRGETRRTQFAIQRKTKQLQAANEELNSISNTDLLTNLTSRRKIESFAIDSLSTCARLKTRFNLYMLDLDYFKGLNDSSGHDAGDDALRCVAGFLAQEFRRRHDLAGRFGGEEFVCISMGEENTHDNCQKLIAGIQELAIPNSASPDGHLTVSLGCISLYPTKIRIGKSC